MVELGTGIQHPCINAAKAEFILNQIMRLGRAQGCAFFLITEGGALGFALAWP
jgi:hypothetical protein